MKVVQFIGSRELGGAERFFTRLSNSLPSGDLDCSALVARGSKLTTELDSVCEVPILSVFDPISQLLASRKLESLTPDIVQSWMGRATRLTPKKRSYVHVARLGGYYRTKHYQTADHLVGNTKGICDYLVREGFDASKVSHISNFVTPIDVDRNLARRQLCSELGISQSTKIIFSLGRLHQNKGFDTLLYALHRLSKICDISNIRLVVAGDGALRSELEAMTSELDLDDYVVWLGWRDDVAQLMASSDLFVCPSRHEPLGNVILEAWSQRLPVISTANQGACEIAQHEQSAIIVPVNDSEALGNAIQSWFVSDDYPTYAKLAAEGYKVLQANFSESIICGSYKSLYNSLIS